MERKGEATKHQLAESFKELFSGQIRSDGVAS